MVLLFTLNSQEVLNYHVLFSLLKYFVYSPRLLSHVLPLILLYNGNLIITLSTYTDTDDIYRYCLCIYIRFLLYSIGLCQYVIQPLKYIATLSSYFEQNHTFKNFEFNQCVTMRFTDFSTTQKHIIMLNLYDQLQQHNPINQLII